MDCVIDDGELAGRVHSCLTRLGDIADAADQLREHLLEVQADEITDLEAARLLIKLDKIGSKITDLELGVRERLALARQAAGDRK
jgi:hypothetical protein